MRRKVNLVGVNTLTVSLPSNWIKENNIKKGDELEVSSNKGTISFSLEKKAPEKKSISINIDNYSYYNLSRHLEVLYKAHYDDITLVYSKPTILDFKKKKDVPVKKTIRRIVNRFVGAEIVSQTVTKTEIRCFVAEENIDIHKIEKRIYFLIKETFEDLLNSIGHEYSEFHDMIYENHDNITKFVNYFLRTLYESDKSDIEKKMGFALYTFMDHLADKIRHLSEKINKYGCSDNVKKYLRKMIDLFLEAFNLASGTKVKEDVINKRYKLKDDIEKEKFNVKELKVIDEIKTMLDYFNYIQEYIYSKSLN